MISMLEKEYSVFLKTLLAGFLVSWSASLYAEEGDAAASEAMEEAAPAVEAAPAEASAPAATYSCTHGDKVRVIEVVYLNPPAKVPCEVNYSKQTEEPGVTSTPWSAANLEGYCEEKAAEFAQKQEGWGWDCR